MKLWIKTIICLMLVFIIALSPITTGILQIRKAEASFVPFIVENAEWLLAILAALGISFTTSTDAMAGIHDFAYNLDNTIYDILQNEINRVKGLQDIKKGLAIGVLNELGVLEPMMDYVNNLPGVLAAAGTGLIVEYLSSSKIEGVDKGDFIEYPWIYGPLEVVSLDIIIPNDIANENTYYVCWIVDNEYILDKSLYTHSNENVNYIRMDKRYYANILPGEYKFTYSLRSTGSGISGFLRDSLGNVILNNTGGNTISVTPDSFAISSTGVIADLTKTENISHLLEKDIGISIDENIGALPLPSQGISSPWDNTVIVPPKSVSEGVSLSPQDVLQAPVIDSWDNPVYDQAGNPVYTPVPETWPYTGEGYPPWTLTPDLPGIAEGVGDIGGILEKTRDYVRDLGRVITQDIPRILTTDLPIAIENIFKGTPPDDDENNDVTDKMKDFKLPDLIFLFFGVILACIRLMIRFITFLTSLLLRPADGSIIPAGMKESLNFLKNWSIGLPVSFYTLFSSLMAFFFGLRMIKYIKIFVANVHGGITQSYDPREFNDNEVYNEWSRSGYKTEYSEYRKVYDNWKDSNSNLPWKGYLKREARGRKW